MNLEVYGGYPFRKEKVIVVNRHFSSPFNCHSEDYDAESLWNHKRQRLFDHLDSLHDKPITWIAAPAGSGKTTLVSSWLSERKLHSLWYQIDEGDAHLADFFYYMGLASKKASPRSKGALPLLTPEYLQGIPVFTRRYFEMLFEFFPVCLIPPFLL